METRLNLKTRLISGKCALLTCLSNKLPCSTSIGGPGCNVPLLPCGLVGDLEFAYSIVSFLSIFSPSRDFSC